MLLVSLSIVLILLAIIVLPAFAMQISIVASAAGLAYLAYDYRKNFNQKDID